MSHVPYAPFSLDCVKDVVRIVRSGAVVDELPLLAKCAHTLAGTALGATIGEPENVEPIFGAGDQPTDAQLEECRDALQEVAASEEQFGASSPKAIGPLGMLLIQLAIKAITEWLSKRQQGS